MRGSLGRKDAIKTASGGHGYGRLFSGILGRCTNPANPNFHNYGGRGIQCRFADWTELEDALGPRPSADHSIDRIDNNGHYEFGNVRWATPEQQAKNSRNCKFKNLEDIALAKIGFLCGIPIKDTAEYFGVTESTTKQKIKNFFKSRERIHPTSKAVSIANLRKHESGPNIRGSLSSLSTSDI